MYNLFKRFAVYDPTKQSLYDPTKYSLYDTKRQFIVSTEQSIYDPEIFGLYDIKTQRVIAKVENLLPGINFDIIMRESQRFCKMASFSLCTDRYTLVMQYLIPGEGILLDACTTSPQENIRLGTEKLGYRYLPIDINGDGDIVKRENLTKLSFTDSSIAAIISLDTLEHIENYTEGLAELYRVLKEDGLMVIHVPSYYFDRQDSQPIDQEKDPWGHVRFFSAVELIKNIYEAGFIIMRIAYQFDYGAVICVASKKRSITADR
jgi:predicted SAM-dependent methyltransferase